MKRTLFLATAAALTAAFNNGEPLSLVNTKTGNVVVEFQQGRVSFNDRFLEAEMKETGILIPTPLTNEFSGKEVVYLGDPDFERAFIEVYYPFCIAHSLYQWKQS